MERLQALPSSIPERSQEFVIDSDNLPGYLHGVISEQRESNIAQHLDIRVFQHFIKGITEASNVVAVYSKEEIEEAYRVDGSKAFAYINELFGEVFAREQEKDRMKKAQGEVSSLIFADSAARLVTNTIIDLGDYKQTHIRYHEVEGRMENGEIIPLIEVHSHPDTSPFSSLDYTRMITAGFTTPRVVRGTVVVCPDMQLLGIATSQTPIVPREEIEEQIRKNEEYINAFMRDNRTDNQNKYDRQYAMVEARFDELTEITRPQLLELRDMMVKYQMNDDQVKDAIKAIYFFADPNLEELIKEQDILCGLSSRDWKRVSYAAHLSLARNLYIKLYSSTDMRHFTAFTA